MHARLVVALWALLAGRGDSGDKTDGKQLPPSVVFARVAPSVVVVEVNQANGRSQGSGVVVGAQEIVTNHHVVKGGGTITVRQAARTWPATLLAFDPKRDLALLRVPGLALPKVVARPSSLVKVGDRVYAIGTPRGLELTFSEGLVSALRAEKSASLIQTTAPISPGSSGGGLFDAQGRLIGILTFSVRGQNLNFAHPTEWITELRGTNATTTADPPPDDGSRFGVSHRPPLARCTLQTRAVWGVFSGGAEVVESVPVNATMDFKALDTQLPKRLGDAVYRKAPIELVLADLNRELSYAAFTPVGRDQRFEYYFLFDDDGKMLLTVIELIDFHGQPRLLANSGPCESLTEARLVKVRAAATSSTEQDCDSGKAASCLDAARAAEIGGARGDALGLYLKACDLRTAEGCSQAAKLYDAIDNTKARGLRRRAEELSSAPAKTP